MKQKNKKGMKKSKYWWKDRKKIMMITLGERRKTRQKQRKEMKKRRQPLTKKFYPKKKKTKELKNFSGIYQKPWINIEKKRKNKWQKSKNKELFEIIQEKKRKLKIMLK